MRPERFSSVDRCVNGSRRKHAAVASRQECQIGGLGFKPAALRAASAAVGSVTCRAVFEVGRPSDFGLLSPDGCRQSDHDDGRDPACTDVSVVRPCDGSSPRRCCASALRHGSVSRDHASLRDGRPGKARPAVATTRREAPSCPTTGDGKLTRIKKKKARVPRCLPELKKAAAARNRMRADRDAMCLVQGNGSIVGSAALRSLQLPSRLCSQRYVSHLRARRFDVSDADRQSDPSRHSCDMKFGFIAKHRGIWPVTWLCAALGVSRSGFHAWLGRALSSPVGFGATCLAEGISSGVHRIELLICAQAL